MARMLSLDGGGIRGLSSLLILEKIMEEIRQEKGLDQVPKPCDYFDLIGGTSTGGIIAIMLGRLGMTVDECIRAYKKVAQQAFTPKKRISIIPGNPSGAFSATALESAIKQTIRDHCPQCLPQRQIKGSTAADDCTHDGALFRDNACTKTAVLAITKDNVDARPKLFTTYDAFTPLAECTIWQVARATSAATTFFKPIKVGRDEVEFIDAGFGYNNPCEVLIAEAEKQFPDKELQILSIGTGLGNVATIKETRLSIVKALKKMATTSTTVAARLADKHEESGLYYRFNVDRGLQDTTLSDWEKASRISAHTMNYLANEERQIKKYVASTLTEARRAEPASGGGDHAAEVDDCQKNHYLPFPKNKQFVERSEVIATLKEKLFTDAESRPIALVGLGGMGKTQLALHIAHWAKDNKPEYSVLWISAVSIASFEQSCKRICVELRIPRHGDEDIRGSLKRHLSSERTGNWFLVIDNVDEISLLDGTPERSGGVLHFLPQNDNGRILITTRSREVAVDIPDTRVEMLPEMSREEALCLLRGSHGKVPNYQLGDETIANELLDNLTRLPLAVAQASAYMEKNQTTVRDYLQVFQKTDQDKLELLQKRIRDYAHYDPSQGTVAKTWFISFEKIQKEDERAAKILQFISCIEPKAVPRSLLPPFETEQQTVSAIGTLRGYGFLSMRKNGDDEVYDVHSLVHFMTKIWASGQTLAQVVRDNALRHVDRVFPTDDWENRELWRQYLPHALKLLAEKQNLETEFCGLGFWVCRCLETDGRIREALKMLMDVVAIEEMKLAEDDPSRLVSQHTLASLYGKNGEIAKGIKLLERVVTIKEKVLAEDHPDRLASQHTLASLYEENGEIAKGIELIEKVVAIEEIILAEDHPDRLASQHALASLYNKNGEIAKGIELLEKVVAIREMTLAEDHPSRLASQNNLASLYNKNGEIAKGIELLEKVIAIREMTLAEDHPDRLASQHALASLYNKNGEIAKGIELLEKVVAIREMTLAEDHPDQLASQHNLASAYEWNGQIMMAAKLVDYVVGVERIKFPENHPSRQCSEDFLLYMWVNYPETMKNLCEEPNIL